MSKKIDNRFVFSAAAILGAALLTANCASNRPEPSEIRDARLALQDAKSAGADQLAVDAYGAAQTNLRTAESQWKAKGGESAIHYARMADSQARDAQYRALARRAQDSIDAGGRRKTELELAVRDAELKATNARAQSMSERQRMEAEARLRQERERSESALATREAAQRAADEKTRALQAQLDAERQKGQDQQRQAEVDRLKAEIAEQKKAADAARRSADEQVAAAQRAADQERARAEETRRQAAEKEKAAAEHEKAQGDLLIRLQQIEKSTRVEARGIVVTLPGSIYFDSGRSDVKPAVRDHLAQIGKALAGATDRKVLVEGHTDSAGAADFNMKLSDLRAEAVKAVLVANSVSPDRIETHGYGPTKPVASNATASGKSQNRRVEVVVQGSAR